MNQLESLATFLPFTASQKSVSLIIADSDTAADAAITELEAKGYRPFTTPRDLQSEGLRYVRISENNAKEMYDLAVQYGTGQITMYDESSHQNTWTNPRYDKSALVFIVTKHDLESIESTGLILRTVTGITTQI